MTNLDEYVENLIEKYPDINKILLDYNVLCSQCGEVYWGTLKELFDDHNVEDNIQNEIIEKINEITTK